MGEAGASFAISRQAYSPLALPLLLQTGMLKWRVHHHHCNISRPTSHHGPPVHHITIIIAALSSQLPNVHPSAGPASRVSTEGPSRRQGESPWSFSVTTRVTPSPQSGFA